MCGCRNSAPLLPQTPEPAYLAQRIRQIRAGKLAQNGTVERSHREDEEKFVNKTPSHTSPISKERSVSGATITAILIAVLRECRKTKAPMSSQRDAEMVSESQTTTQHPWYTTSQNSTYALNLLNNGAFFCSFFSERRKR